jgi:hypothetical protein
VLNLEEGRAVEWPVTRGRPFSADVRGEDAIDCCRLSFQVAREGARCVRVGSSSELLASSASCRNKSAFASGCVWSIPAASCAVKASSVASSLEGLRLPVRVVGGSEPARVWDDVWAGRRVGRGVLKLATTA